MKKFSIMSIILLAITLFIGSGNVSAKDWGITLSPATIATGGDNWDYKHYNTSSYISLTRIVGGPSYYIKGKAVNADKESRSDYMLIQQGAGAVYLTNDTMGEGYKYWVLAKNTVFETSYRWAYGEFGW
ncbi:hypothetical protein [Clostridium kluyveri]|uniref:Bacteriocin n=1 Tax=Clostridium kluyveri TaxID=1534 RepID=A0A1L5FCT4_CLOKL|nr:hypothetical protein [Clostridium kluyveri]APM40825.1 hypothetical protein BS101_19990 [Clostridium kluyveri]